MRPVYCSGLVSRSSLQFMADTVLLDFYGNAFAGLRRDNMDEYEQVKRGRGRPKGSKNKPKPVTADRIATATIKEAYPDMSKEKLDRALTKETGMSFGSLNYLEKKNEKGGKGEKAKAADFILKCREISRYSDHDNIDTLYACFDAYLKLCIAYDYTISNMTAYMAIGVHRRDIDRWASGERRKSDSAYKEFAEMVRNVCSAARDLYGMEGITDRVISIYHQKAFDKLSDQPMPDKEESSPLGEMKDAESLAKKYENIPLD